MGRSSTNTPPPSRRICWRRWRRSNLAVINADQPRALRDQQRAAGRTVIDVLGNLGGDLPREIGADAGDQRGGNDRARLHDEGRRRLGEPVGAGRAAIDRGIDESELAAWPFCAKAASVEGRAA